MFSHILLTVHACIDASLDKMVTELVLVPSHGEVGRASSREDLLVCKDGGQDGVFPGLNDWDSKYTRMREMFKLVFPCGGSNPKKAISVASNSVLI